MGPDMDHPQGARGEIFFWRGEKPWMRYRRRRNAVYMTAFRKSHRYVTLNSVSA